MFSSQILTAVSPPRKLGAGCPEGLSPQAGLRLTAHKSVSPAGTPAKLCAGLDGIEPSPCRIRPLCH